MNAELFIEEYGGTDGFFTTRIGLYIIRPLNLTSQFAHIYRCGAGGLKETADERGRASLASRMQSHLNAMIGGFEVLAICTVKRSVFTGHSWRRATSQNGIKPGDTKLRVQEKRFHELILERGGVRAREGTRQEWFRGTQRQLIGAMRDTGVGTLYTFDARGILTTEVLKREDPEGFHELPVRRSPRFAAEEEGVAEMDAPTRSRLRRELNRLVTAL